MRFGGERGARVPAPPRTLSGPRPPAPKARRAALAMLADDPMLTPMAGCTDIFVGLHFATLGRRGFLDLWGLDELRGVRVDGSKGASLRSGAPLRIGALVTFTEIIKSRLVQRR